MNEQNDNKKQDDELSRLLKQLPKVEASPEFESRLQRRITGKERHREGKSIFDIFSMQWRIPVVATSILSLLAVSVISYYLFRKTPSVIVPTIATNTPPAVANKETQKDNTGEQAEPSEAKSKGAVISAPGSNQFKKQKSSRMVNQPAPQTKEAESDELKSDQGVNQQEMNEMSIQPSNVVAESTLQITTDRQLTVPSAPILKKSAPGDQQSPASKIIEGQANTAKRVYLMKINGDTSLADSLRRDSIRRVQMKTKKPKP